MLLLQQLPLIHAADAVADDAGDDDDHRCHHELLLLLSMLLLMMNAHLEDVPIVLNDHMVSQSPRSSELHAQVSSHRGTTCYVFREDSTSSLFSNISAHLRNFPAPCISSRVLERKHRGPDRVEPLSQNILQPLVMSLLIFQDDNTREETWRRLLLLLNILALRGFCFSALPTSARCKHKHWHCLDQFARRDPKTSLPVGNPCNNLCKVVRDF